LWLAAKTLAPDRRRALALGRGFTLLEALIVMVVLGLAAAVCLPVVGGYLDDLKLEAAAQDAIDALGFAQAESQRTQTVYGVGFDPATATRSVFYLDALAVPALAVNPVDKNPYLLRYADDPRLSGLTITSARFEYEDGEQTRFVEFDQRGTPRRSLSGQPLASGEVVFALGERERTLIVRPNGTAALQ